MSEDQPTDVQRTPLHELVAPAERLWRSPRGGPALRVALALLVVPFIGTIFVSPTPSVGVYLQGVVVGTQYALLAMGLILVYRANHIINFAQASMGGAAAIAGILLMSRRGWPYPIALLVALVGAVAIGALVEVAIIRRFSRSPRLILTLATIGVAQVLLFLELMVPRFVGGNTARALRISTPFSGWRAEIGGIFFSGDHLMTVLLAVVVGAGLAVLVYRTSIGMAIRASAENADRASLLGIPVRRVATIVWVVAALISSIAVFQRMTVVRGLSLGGVSASTLLFGLAPAVIARMRSLPIACLSAIVLGMADQIVFWQTRNATISNAMLLPIILIALLVQRGKFSRAEDTGVATWQQVKEFRGIPTELRRVPQVVAAQWILRVAVVAIIFFLPNLAGPGRTDLASLLMIYATIGISLVILTGWAGQISLGQVAFAATGAAVAGGLAANHDVHFIITMLAGGLAGAAVAVLIGIPAIRLPGLYLAVTTLAFAGLIQFFVLDVDYFGWLLPERGSYIERPVLWGRVDLTDDRAFYFLCVSVFALTLTCARSLRSLRTGRVMIAVRDNTRSAQSYGIDPTVTRIAAFALSGFFAALAGGLLAYLTGVIEAGSFAATRSLELFAMAVIGGLTSVGGALAGALYILGFQYFLPDYAILASGVGMLSLMIFFPGGLSELGFNLRDAYLRRIAISQNLYVPSLVADSLHQAARPPANEEQDLVAQVSEHAVEVIDQTGTADHAGSSSAPSDEPLADDATTWGPPAEAAAGNGARTRRRLTAAGRSGDR